ncbi:MAG TPA: hydroxymethylglutaryl-CoA synthase [Candidatus Bathyarchaeota archaeon]|nr:hydroxymethylglutaryl-CoA synthase [Candidatus Bathyarchaeota archaeon]HEW89743.1 hydroxymethylglutaryl-CoA synthase [Candidatus Bathyarchaeota archaeon]
MKPIRPVGIIGYGGYVPAYRIRASEIGRMWGNDGCALPIVGNAVAGPAEDMTTIAYEAARYALLRARIDPHEIGAVFIGSESKPYAVKPSGTIVAEALGIGSQLLAADYEFACKAGTEAFQTCIGLVGSGMARYAMAIGADTAQGKPADELEYTAASGGAAFIFGLKSSETVAYVEGSCSYTTDTADFWRRAGQPYPAHFGRFTGKPAYFRHVITAAKMLMEELGLGPEDFDWAVFHQPNTKFPIKAAKMLGIPREKLEPGLLVPYIGNTYSGSSPLGLAATLDVAKPGDRILMVSYGSGAGSDAFSFVVQEAIEEKRPLAPPIKAFLIRKKYVDYASYARFRGKLLK